MNSVKKHAVIVREGSRALRNLCSQTRISMLQEIHMHFQKYQCDIYRANTQDVERSQELDVRETLIKRLIFDKAKLQEYVL